MEQNFIFLNENNYELFFNVFSQSLQNYYLTKILNIDDFIKYIKYFNINQKTSFILRENSNCIGIFLGSIKANNSYILSIGVLDKFRGNGYGRILLEKGLLCFAEYHVKNISLEVLKDNTSAINLYKSEGFNITKEINNYRNESNSFFTKEYFNDFKITQSDIFGFNILYKSFLINDKPWQKKLSSLISRFENYQMELIILKNKTTIYGYAVISREKNLIQIHDIALKDKYDFLFSFFLTKLLKNEKIVQANGFYKNDIMASLFEKQGFYIDSSQYQMEKKI